MQERLPFVSPHRLAGMPKESPVLLAFSGGADSSALLHLLCRLRKSYDFPLYAAHVNHGIRTENYGNEALRDEEFCRRLCEKWEIPFVCERVDIPAIAKREKCGLEEAARNARYKIFSKRFYDSNF